MIFTKNKEGVPAIRAIKYKKYVAGKYTRAPAPFARKHTNLNSVQSLRIQPQKILPIFDKLNEIE